MKHELPKPTPEMLAAYVDGELQPCERDLVETWLADHPDARTDVAMQKQLAKLYGACPPVEPDEPTWTAAFAGIESRLPLGPRVVRHRRIALGWLVGVAAAAAAVIAAIVFFGFNRSQPPRPVPTPPQLADNEPWPVVGAEDVEITSIAEADRDTVVVGELPVNRPLALVAHGDVHMGEMTPEKGMTVEYFADPNTPPMVISEPRKAP